MNVITRGIRNAFRNVVRTFSVIIILGLSIGLSLTMLIAYRAVNQKITTIKSSVDNTITIRPAGVNGFQGGGNPLTTAELAKVGTLPHVTHLSESLNDRLNSSDTNLTSSLNLGSLGKRFQRFQDRFGGSANFNPATFSPPITVVGTNNTTSLDSSNGSGTITIVSGTNINGNVDKDVALVGQALATKNNLKVGSTFSAYSTTFTVAGIFNAGNTFSNSQLILSLPTEQRLSGQSGDVTSAVATVDSVNNLNSVTSSIKTTLGSTADVISSIAQAQNTIQPLNSVKSIALFSLIGAIVAGAVIILLIMVMIVRERRKEIGVIKAIGGSNVRIMLQFMSEAVVFTVLGACVGLIIGVIGGQPVTKLLVQNTSSQGITSGVPGVARRPGGFGGGFARQFGAHGVIGTGLRNIHATVGWSILLYGLLVAVLIAIIGSAVASILIAKVRPAEVMRAE